MAGRAPTEILQHPNELQAEPMEHFQFILEAHDGAVMTVRMNQSPAIELMTRIRRDVFEKEFTEQEGLASQPLSIQVVRKKTSRKTAQQLGSKTTMGRPVSI